MPEPDAQDVARRALPLLDLTDLTCDCDAAAIEKLCARALTPYGHVAAVCIWPRFVAQAKPSLAETGVKIATVVNFPDGGEDLAAIQAETRQALADGAREIDLVMPYRAFLAGRRRLAEDFIRKIRATIAPPARLKVILETGALEDAGEIRAASKMAVAAGADFIKTSTGKTAINATVEAARIMLEVIAATGGRVGFKPAGGIRTVEDARAYLTLADEILGAGWATPQTFRFGASGLLDVLNAALEGGDAPAEGGY